MSFARLHKLVTYLIAGLGLFALTLGGELGIVPSLALGIGLVLSFFAEEPLIAREEWVRGWTFAVVALFALQVMRGLGGEPLLALGLEYAGFLQISRLMNRRTARDHQQIAVLAFLHLIAATVLSSSLGYAAIFIGFVIVTPWMLALSHLRREIEGYYPGGGTREAQTVADVRRVLASRRVVGPGFLAATAALVLPIFAITIALFLLFPRVGMGFLSFGRGTGQQTAGFGRDVELGGFGVIRDDPTVILRVSVPDDPSPSRDRTFRMRGTSFDHYDGRRWSRSPSGGVGLRRLSDYYQIVRWRDETDRRFVIDLDHLDEPVIFLPAGTVGIGVPPRIRGGAELGRQVYASPGHDFRYLDDDDLGLAYTAWVSRTPDEVGVETLTDDERSAYLQRPAAMERIARLAERVTEGAQSDAERARLVERYLRDSGTFEYTLRQPDTRGRDPLEVFLFEARRGHCEYFSTAMAMMLRSLGIPARNVTGLVGGRFNEYGQYYALRQGDAHSWVEAHVDGRWTTFDPTPAGRAELGPMDGPLADLSALIDALRTRWSRDVVGYDLRVQTRALRDALTWLSRFRGSNDEREEPGASDAISEGETPYWPWLVAATALALLVALRFRRRQRAGDRSERAAPEALAAARLYRELERALKKRGRPRPSSHTPSEHADALRREGFPSADAVAEVTHRYVGARWGAEPLDPKEIARLKALIARVRTEKAVRSDT